MLTIERLYLPYGTPGIAAVDGELICPTLELPWKDNKNDISCIPAGTYQCEKAMYHPRPTPTNPHPKPYLAIKVNNVQGRTGIWAHVGNYLSQILGCILPGVEVSYSAKDAAAHNSRLALEKLLAKLPDKFELKIF